MASIIERNKKYSVVYYVMADGKRKQMWESFPTLKEAKARKAAVENEINDGTFIPPNKQTIREFLQDYVKLYGEEKWSLSTYSTNIAFFDNYVNPLIGDESIQTFTAKSADMYFKRLKKTPATETGCHKPRTEFVGPSILQTGYKLLRCAFGKAVKWEIIKRNPFELVDKPKYNYKRREIWDAETIRMALDECRDSKLYVAMNISFACSLRIGEILGLTWDNIHISDQGIADDNANLFVEKELQRASLQAIKILDEKDIKYMFPTFKPNATTRLVLKTPKTESSVRKVWIPKTLAYILLEYRKTQESMREMLGDEYYDHNLVVALPNGRPCEERVIIEAFHDLREKCGLPYVAFHSLRHSSTTYKLKLNKGDIKATQGDTGHAQADMVTRVYAHILDEDRKVNAVKMEQAFYSPQANPDLRSVRPPADASSGDLDVEAFIAKLRNASPEKLAVLAELFKG
ncbi:MAG: site-specific integrase [Oscillospiraceae bacterium]|nr:site-specific integrase [Oscillospiraceae bacterium]